jgi:putative ABC transport system substrate-binding protein
MRRRGVLELLVGAAMLPPFAAAAAGEPAKVFRLGVLSTNPPGGPGYRTFVQQLRALDYEKGRTLQIDYVQLDSSDADHSLAMTEELVDRGVDAIFAPGPEVAVKMAVMATRTVPIVMLAADYDPLTHGYIASLARPGANVTGVFRAAGRANRKTARVTEPNGS